MKYIAIVLAIMLLGLQLRLWSGDGGVIEVMQLKAEVGTQQDQVEQLSERNQILEAEVKDLKNRMGALEERARTDLGMIKKNETFYQDAS